MKLLCLIPSVVLLGLEPLVVTGYPHSTNGTSRGNFIASRMVRGNPRLDLVLPPVPPSFTRTVPPSPDFLQHLRASEFPGPSLAQDAIDVGWNQDDNIKVGFDGIVRVARLFDEGALFMFGPKLTVNPRKSRKNSHKARKARYVFGARFALDAQAVIDDAIKQAWDVAAVSSFVLVLPNEAGICNYYGPELERRLQHRLVLSNENVSTIYAAHEPIAPGQSTISLESFAATVSEYSIVRYSDLVGNVAVPVNAPKSNIFDAPDPEIAATIESMEIGRVSSSLSSLTAPMQPASHEAQDEEMSAADLLANMWEIDNNPADAFGVLTPIQDIRHHEAFNPSNSTQPVAPVSDPADATQRVTPQENIEDAEVEAILATIQELQSMGELEFHSSTPPIPLQPVVPQSDVSQSVPPQSHTPSPSRPGPVRPSRVRLRPILPSPVHSGHTGPQPIPPQPIAPQPLSIRPLHYLDLPASFRGAQNHGIPHPAEWHQPAHYPGFIPNTSTPLLVHPIDVLTHAPQFTIASMPAEQLMRPQVDCGRYESNEVQSTDSTDLCIFNMLNHGALFVWGPRYDNYRRFLVGAKFTLERASTLGDAIATWNSLGPVDTAVIVVPATHDTISRYTPKLISILRLFLPFAHIMYISYPYYPLTGSQGYAYSFTANLWDSNLQYHQYIVSTVPVVDPQATRWRGGRPSATPFPEYDKL